MTPASAARRALVGLLAVAFAAGCGHGGKTPSEPFIQARITTRLASAGPPTLVEAQLYFDGQLVQDQTVATPTASLQFSALGTLPPANLMQVCSGGEADLGPHTLDLTIVKQTASPSPYIVSGTQIVVTTAGFTQLPLPDQSGPLASGQSFHWSFCL